MRTVKRIGLYIGCAFQTGSRSDSPLPIGWTRWIFFGAVATVSKRLQLYTFVTMHFFSEAGNSSFFTVARLNFARLSCSHLLVINKTECNSTISIGKRMSYLQHYLLLRITSSYCLDIHIACIPLASRVLIGGSTIEKRARHQHALLRSQEPGKVFRIFLSNFVVFCFFKSVCIFCHIGGGKRI